MSPKIHVPWKRIKSLTNKKGQLDLYGFDCSFLMLTQSKNKQYMMALTYQERSQNGITHSCYFEWQMANK